MPKSKRKYIKTRYQGVRRYVGDDCLFEIYYRPYRGAKPKYVTITASSAEEARKERVRLQNEDMNLTGISRRGEPMNFEGYKSLLIEKCKTEDVDKTIRNYLAVFTRFYTWLSGAPANIEDLSRINSVVMELYHLYVVNELKLDWRNELTKIRAIIKKFVDIGKRDEKVYTDVLRKIKKPPRKEKAYVDISPEDKKIFLEYTREKRPDYYGILYLNMRFGWRREQVILLRKSDVSIELGRPVAITFRPETTKTKVPYVFRDIDEQLAAVLNEYRLKALGSEYLFPNKSGGKHHSNHYTSWVTKNSLKVLGKKIRPHDFRHAFCTKMLQKGYSKKDIMAVTGHRSEGCFDMYVHATSEGTRRVIESSAL
ncbi:MAG: tyrosine-type recombinase/integrase [Candidatus Omnitrophota bacterium]